MRLKATTLVVFLLMAICIETAAEENDLEDVNCAGSGAKVRQLMLYDLRSPDPANLAAFNKLFQHRLLECETLLYPGSSYGGPAYSTAPILYGFVPSRPMPESAAIADWVGWMDFTSLEGVKECLEINNSTGTLQAMQAYAQPNGRIGLVTYKQSLPGNKHEPCPLPGSYAPATVRYVFAYILPPGINTTAACDNGTALFYGLLKELGLDVRHSCGCSLLADTLTDEQVQAYGLTFYSGFGGYVDFVSTRDMTRMLASNNPKVQRRVKQLRRLAFYAVRSAIPLPWSGRR